MEFTIVSVSDANVEPDPKINNAVLVTDNWEDWFRFGTMYRLIVWNANGEKIDVGPVKIGQFGMKLTCFP